MVGQHKFVILTMLVALSAAVKMPITAAYAETIECTVIASNQLVCDPNFNVGGPAEYVQINGAITVHVNIAPPFSEEPGRCVGKARDVQAEIGTFNLLVDGSFGGCPYQEDELVPFVTEPPMFVLPGSPSGTIAMITASMITASMGALGGFLYFRMARKPLA